MHRVRGGNIFVSLSGWLTVPATIVCTLNILNVILICFITSLGKLRHQTFDIASRRGEKIYKQDQMEWQTNFKYNKISKSKQNLRQRGWVELTLNVSSNFLLQRNVTEIHKSGK